MAWWNVFSGKKPKSYDAASLSYAASPGPMADSSKSGWQKIKDDVQMDMGIKEPDEDYYARYDERGARTRAHMAAMSKLSDENNRSSILTKKEEEEEEEEEEEKEEEEDGVKKLDQDLDLENVDDTEESIAATAKANEEYTEVVDQSGATFGTGEDETGSDVTSVVQADESFIDADLKAAQEAAATSATDLKKAKTFNGIYYEDQADMISAINQFTSAQAALTLDGVVYDSSDAFDAAVLAKENAAASGGASSILNLAGSNTTTGNSGDALDQVTVAEQNLNTSSALGGSMEAAAAQPTSTGAAEDKAIENYEKGRRSTILTTPEGLLNDDELEEDGTFRKKRGLIV